MGEELAGSQRFGAGVWEETDVYLDNRGAGGADLLGDGQGFTEEVTLGHD